MSEAIATVADHMQTDLVTLTADMEIIRADAFWTRRAISSACCRSAIA
jgi:hypothetical protein